MNILRSNSEYKKRWNEGEREEVKMEIARIYFKTALKLTKELNLKANRNNYENEDDFAESIGIPED